jgi:hypothetical protein
MPCSGASPAPTCQRRSCRSGRRCTLGSTAPNHWRFSANGSCLIERGTYSQRATLSVNRDLGAERGGVHRANARTQLAGFEPAIIVALARRGQLALAATAPGEEADAAEGRRSSRAASTGRTISRSARSLMLVRSASERRPARCGAPGRLPFHCEHAGKRPCRRPKGEGRLCSRRSHRERRSLSGAILPSGPGWRLKPPHDPDSNVGFRGEAFPLQNEQPSPAQSSSGEST